MKQLKLPERGDIKKMIQRELHEQLREDVKVEVAFVVNFDAGDPAIVNTIIDPIQPFPRWKCRAFVKDIVAKLKELEEKAPYKTFDTQGTAVSTIPTQISGAAQTVL
jgi:hypothetical protein